MLNSQPASQSDSAARQVLIVDDHPVVRGGMRMIITQEPGLAVCAEAGDIAQAMELVARHQPHLAIVDLSLRDGSGLDLIKRIRAQHPGVKILVSSVHDERFYAQRVLHAGASGFVHKQEAAKVIMQAIRKVLDGGIYLSGLASERMLRQAVGGELDGQPGGKKAVDGQADGHGAGSPGRSHGKLGHLSDRELEVLELIGRGMGTAQIAKQLYLSPKTIDTYREHLKTKLNLKNSVELVRYAVQWEIEQAGGQMA